MTHHRSIKRTTICCLAALLTAPFLNAVPVTFAPGDLVVGFQRGSADSDLYLLSLGSITTYRDASSSLINITNINTDLEAAFPGWAGLTDLYLGAFAMFSRTGANPNGDPGQTIYFTRARTSTSTQSTPFGAISTSDDNTVGAAIAGVQTTFDAAEASANASGAIMLTSASTYDDQNPPTSGNLSWGVFNSLGLGTQYKFTGSDFGNFGIGGLGASRAAVDLYQVLGESSLPGTQNASFNGVSSYRGTLSIDSAGNVSYLVVPEPSAVGLVLLGAAFLAIRKRRSLNA